MSGVKVSSSYFASACSLFSARLGIAVRWYPIEEHISTLIGSHGPEADAHEQRESSAANAHLIVTNWRGLVTMDLASAFAETWMGDGWSMD